MIRLLIGLWKRHQLPNTDVRRPTLFTTLSLYLLLSMILYFFTTIVTLIPYVCHFFVRIAVTRNSCRQNHKKKWRWISQSWSKESFFFFSRLPDLILLLNLLAFIYSLKIYHSTIRHRPMTTSTHSTKKKKNVIKSMRFTWKRFAFDLYFMSNDDIHKKPPKIIEKNASE